MDAATSGPLNVFISYAHEDEELCQKLLAHLSQLHRDGVQGWYDRKLTGGADWVGEIDEHLETADIILFLISTDFLASTYCYDVEMKRALERHAQGRARIVPVILRPCDWKNSPFVKFNVLPTDGKAVVDWKTLDHGFLNVVECLRRVIEELRARPAALAPASSEDAKPAFRNFPKVQPLRWAVVAALAVLLAAGGWFWRSRQQQYIAQGEASLDVGRYNEARQPFQQALRWNPWSARATRGLETAKLYDLMAKPVEFEQKLNQLSKEAPNDAHLKILEGDYHLWLNRRDQAQADYQKAAALNPQIAEAYFRMCVLCDIEGNRGKAFEMCQKAVQRSPLSPQYRDNLAAQYFKHGDYPQAIREYAEVVDGYPLAKLELAKIRRLQFELDDAREKGQAAIDELKNDSVMASLPENSLPWDFQVSPREGVSLASKDQKLCYAHLELSATDYLLGEESQAVESSNLAAKTCGSQTRDVKAVVDWELARVADERNELAPKVEAFRRGLLARWGSPSH